MSLPPESREAVFLGKKVGKLGVERLFLEGVAGIQSLKSKPLLEGYLVYMHLVLWGGS